MNSKSVQVANLSTELQNLTNEMVFRIKTGCNSLTALEQMLMDMINDPNTNLKKDPNFILKVCQYFRTSVSLETKAVWDFALNMRAKLPAPTRAKSDDSIVQLLQDMPANERESLRGEMK